MRRAEFWEWIGLGKVAVLLTMFTWSTVGRIRERQRRKRLAGSQSRR
jgi:hypothetical protein